MTRSDIVAQCAVEHKSGDEYVSKLNPRPQGNVSPIAFGGNTIGTIVLAAYATIKGEFYLFSLLGSYLGPTRIDRKLCCRVTRTRDTKTFATRHVVAYQILDDGTERNCADFLLDFHVKEEGMYEYSVLPSAQYRDVKPEDPDKTMLWQDTFAKFVTDGHVSEKMASFWKKSFSMSLEFFDTRTLLNSVAGQNGYGLAKRIKTSQDDLSITEKSSADWSRCKKSLKGAAENAAALAFSMDGGLSFLPLAHDHKTLTDAGACSTLDISLRFFRSDVDYNQWHLRERKTLQAHAGRTMSESRLWDEKGQLVAWMSQVSIMRPPAPKKEKGAKM